MEFCYYFTALINVILIADKLYNFSKYYNLQAPDGQYLRPTITDNKDATVTVHYTPEDVGKYKAKVKYGGDPIPGSPFDVNTKPSGDASKCQITGLYSETPCLFYHVIASGLLDLA